MVLRWRIVTEAAEELEKLGISYEVIDAQIINSLLILNTIF